VQNRAVDPTKFGASASGVDQVFDLALSARRAAAMDDGQRAQQRAAPLRCCALDVFLVLLVNCVALRVAPARDCVDVRQMLHGSLQPLQL
jgi:hypothetical protein